MKSTLITFTASLLVALLSPVLPSGDTSRPAMELCSPDEIVLGDVLTVRIPQPAVDEMAVSDPLGRWFYLQGPGVIRPLLGEREFTEAEMVTLNTATLVGTVYIDGSGEQLPVFTVPGQYRIHLSDNLETEPENSLNYECVIMVKKREGG
jgi:hypothetical protein